jgi:hypothetical protein
MPRDVVVIFVHGIGVESNKYDERLRIAIQRHLDPSLRTSVEFHSVFWADAVRDRQRGFLEQAAQVSGFKAHGFHKFVIERLGDAAAYQKTSRNLSATYFTIQDAMRSTIAKANRGAGDSRPLIFVGHSLGCHIASSYAWDLHKMKDQIERGTVNTADAKAVEWARSIAAASPLVRLDTWAGFITMGSNQPLFTFQLPPDQIVPITRTNLLDGIAAFPGRALGPAVHATARWDNYFSANDPLGYPLSPLNQAYKTEKRLRDHAVRSEGWFRSLLAFGWFRRLLSVPAHEGYWCNRTVARGAARMIADIATVAEAPVHAPTSANDPSQLSAPADPVTTPWNIFRHIE